MKPRRSPAPTPRKATRAGMPRARRSCFTSCASNTLRDGLARSGLADQLGAMDEPSPLEQLRRQLALAVGENAVFDGWTVKAVDSAAAQLGIDPVQARLAFPKRQPEMIDCYIREVDRA